MSWVLVFMVFLLSSHYQTARSEKNAVNKHRISSTVETRKLLWNRNNVRDSEVIEPMSIPDSKRDLERLQNVLSESAANENVAAEKRTNFGPARITIFTAPKPFIGLYNETQRLAISSWLRLNPTPLVHLVGNHPSFYHVAREFGKDVVVESNVDATFEGIPLFNSLLARAHVYKYSYTMLVLPDVVILNDIFNALKFVRHTYKNFVLISSVTEVPTLEPQILDPNENGEVPKFREFVKKYGKRNTAKKVGFWFWNNSPVPLINASMLPFGFQRGWHDSWLANEIATAGYRALVDSSDIVTCVRSKKQPSRMDKAATSAGMVSELEKWLDSSNIIENPEPLRLPKWNSLHRSSSELLKNRQLANFHRLSTSNRTVDELAKPLRIRRCKYMNGKKKMTKFCFKTAECSANENLTPQQTDEELEEVDSTLENIDGNNWICGLYLPRSSGLRNRVLKFQKRTEYKQVEDLLPLISPYNNRTVILVAVSDLYRDMLMSFVCMLRRLSLPSPLVGALDPDIYQFAEEQGLAVFYDNSAQKARLESAKNGTACKFGTACFKMVTKLKSRAVLHVLKLGYNVLWSDVDIVWLRDPFKEILEYPVGTFPVQSDQPKRWEPANGANGTSVPGGAINSGFYYARAEPKVIEALEAIVEDAKTTNTSEQPSFFKVLCGNGSTTVGSDECVWPENGLRTIFMPRLLHPNGKYNYYWHNPKTAAACMKKGCATLHNNWIKGRQAKINRMKVKGLWYYDPNNRICLYKWYRSTRGLPLFFTNTDEEEEDQSPVN